MFRGTFWTHGRTNVAGIYLFGEVTQHSRVYEFHGCGHSRTVSHFELLTKIPPLPPAPSYGMKTVHSRKMEMIPRKR